MGAGLYQRTEILTHAFARAGQPGAATPNRENGNVLLTFQEDGEPRRRLAMSIVQAGLLLAFCTPFAAAPWIAFTHRARTTARDHAAPIAEPVAIGFAATMVDLESAIRQAALIDTPAGSRRARIELAVSAAAAVHVDPNALETALRDTLRSAIDAAAGGQVLVTTATPGRQLHIRVTDDGPGVDQQRREMSLRAAQTLIALQGGSMTVEARTGRGTTVTIRLPLPAGAEAETIEAARPPVLVDQAA